MLQPFRVLTPANVEEASAELVRLGERATIYAGGAELILLLRYGMVHADYLINIKGIDGLSEIGWDGRTVQIGATVTHRRLETDSLIRERLPLLADAESRIANIRVRNQGTLGGNLCFNDPHSDPGTTLLLHEAEVVLARKDGLAFDYKRIAGGMLVQTPDESAADEGNFKVATERTPSLEELTDLLFAWRCVKHVTSNAIVLAKGLATVGVGPGQMSRVVAVETAVRKAGENARLAVMASDAYFPFPDGIEVAARAGVTAIIQPGGSLRDAMMIDTANKNHMAMLFTGRRHFKH